MRERKRLESMLSLEGDLARRTGDIAAYFDLAEKVKTSLPNCSANSNLWRELVDRVETETLLSATTTG